MEEIELKLKKAIDLVDAKNNNIIILGSSFETDETIIQIVGNKKQLISTIATIMEQHPEVNKLILSAIKLIEWNKQHSPRYENNI